jgi:large subunit ribosomal protein L13
MSKKYTIDATDKGLGKVASEAARLILGKDLTNFAKNKVAEVSVEVVNAGKMKFSEKKMKEKKYVSFSLYPGGQREVSQKEMMDKKGVDEVIWRAVYKMLPKNRLQAVRIKSLKVTK